MLFKFHLYRTTLFALAPDSFSHRSRVISRGRSYLPDPPSLFPSFLFLPIANYSPWFPIFASSCFLFSLTVVQGYIDAVVTVTRCRLFLLYADASRSSKTLGIPHLLARCSLALSPAAAATRPPTRPPASPKRDCCGIVSLLFSLGFIYLFPGRMGNVLK